MSMQKYEQIKKSRKDIIINNFLGGIAWGLGTTIGVAIILTIFSFLAQEINLIPFVGNFVTQITKYVATHK